jgi:hypothetical protein
LPTKLAQFVEAFERTPNLGFFVGWFALVLLLACALVFSWNAISLRLESRRAQATMPRKSGQDD